MNHRYNISRRQQASAFAMVVFIAATVMGLAGEYDNNEPLKKGYLPDTLVDAANSQKRVYGWGEADAGSFFYFTGNTEDFNRFLQDLAKDEASRLGLTLTTDPGTEAINGLTGTKHVTYSWKLSVRNHRDNVFIELLPDETDVQYQLRSKQVRAKLPKFDIGVRVPIGGSIDAAKMKLPLVFETSVDGRLHRLAQFHNNQRAWALKQGNSLAHAEPTTERKAEEPMTLFDDAAMPEGKKSK